MKRMRSSATRTNGDSYDTFGHAGGPQGAEGRFGGQGGFGDIFNDIFEDFFGQPRGRGRPERGNDLQYNLDLTFEESVFGKEAKLKIPRWETCADCKGTGAKSATAIKMCPACKGQGQLRFQQGFFSVSRPCGQCEGVGTNHYRTLPGLRWTAAPPQRTHALGADSRWHRIGHETTPGK